MTSRNPLTGPLVCALLATCAPRLAAQSRPFQIDRDHSYASFWMGVSAEGNPVNVAVARAAGTASLDVKNPADSALAVTIVPGGGGSSLLAPDGSVRRDEIAPIMRYAFITFHSKQARVRRDGRLEFSGEFTITHVTRQQVTAAWNSANNTPSYTDPLTKTTKREVTLLLTTPHAEFLAAQMQRQQAFVASATFDGGEFPDLASALLGSDWPIVAQDEQCEFPVGAAGRRDYYGAVCTGKAVSTSNPAAPVQASPRGYAGRPPVEAPVNGPVTILLYLKLSVPDSGAAPPR